MIVIAILAIAFAAGIVVGVGALLRLGIAHEESRRSLRGSPSARSTAATRRVLGLYVRMPSEATQADFPYGPAQTSQGSRPRAIPQRQQPRELTSGRPGLSRTDLRRGEPR